MIVVPILNYCSQVVSLFLHHLVSSGGVMKSELHAKIWQSEGFWWTSRRSAFNIKPYDSLWHTGEWRYSYLKVQDHQSVLWLLKNEHMNKSLQSGELTLTWVLPPSLNMKTGVKLTLLHNPMGQALGLSVWTSWHWREKRCSPLIQCNPSACNGIALAQRGGNVGLLYGFFLLLDQNAWNFK